MAQEFHIEFAPRTVVHVEDVEPLGEVQVLVERVAGSPTQEQINAALEAYVDEHPGALLETGNNIFSFRSYLFSNL